MTTDEALTLLSDLVNAEWKRWDDHRGAEEGVDPPRQYDLALHTVREAISAAARKSPTIDEIEQRLGGPTGRQVFRVD